MGRAISEHLNEGPASPKNVNVALLHIKLGR